MHQAFTAASALLFIFIISKSSYTSHRESNIEDRRYCTPYFDEAATVVSALTSLSSGAVLQEVRASLHATEH